MYGRLDLGSDLLERAALIAVSSNWTMQVLYGICEADEKKAVVYFFWTKTKDFLHTNNFGTYYYLHVGLINISCLLADRISVVQHAVLCSELYFLASLIT